ncbi:sensor histidine kinase [Baekduia soli]|uniref:sensor histidine kinase n=1 Tax=Baekduia soli TaxID=496014 RepID=UPI0016525A77|nr:PAS domain S-box protein [Baekduia soli]
MSEALAAPLWAVAEAVQDGVVCSDLRGTITLWMGGAETLFGWSSQEILGRSLAVLVPERLRSAYLAAFAHAAEGRRSDLVGAGVIEVEGLRRDGTAFPAELTLSRGSAHGQPFLVGIVRDISSRRSAEVELALARTRFRSAFEHAATGMTMTSPAGRFLAVNAAFCALVGRTQDDLSELAFSDITHPADQEDDLHHVTRMAAGEVDHVPIAKRYLRPGGEVVWVEGNVSLVRDEHGRPQHYLTQVIDVSERRRAASELERSNAELDQLAAVAAHDLNAPLRIVEGFLRLLEGRAGDALDADARRFVSEALGGARRMRDLIEALLGYARVGGDAVRREAVELGRVAAEAEGALAGAIRGRGVRVRVDALPTVRGDPALLRQVLQNLLGNAVIHADAVDPVVTVSARGTPEAWEIAVADNGPGVPDDLRATAFDLFARGEGGGTGLGLAICRRAVERHGGHIWIAEGTRGADLRFTLPR